MFSHLFSHRLSTWGGRWRGRSQLSGMAAGGLELRPDEDPWKLSAFMSAFTELLLSLLFLLGAAIAFITSQFVKYFELEPPCSYIGCSHPGHSEVPRRKRYPIPSSCANEFSVNDLCPDCVFSRSWPKFPYRNFSLTEGHHDEDASQILKDEDSSSRDDNDKAFGCQNIELTRRNNRTRKYAPNILPNSCLMCAHCNHPLSNSVDQHTFMKKAVHKRRDAHSRPYVCINDERSVDAVSSRAITEDDLPLFSAKPVFAEGNSSDVDDYSETSSISAESMKDFCPERKGRFWTGFDCVFEEIPGNVSESKSRDSEGDFNSCLQGEIFNNAVQDVVNTRSLPSCGFEREIVQPASSRDNCPYVSTVGIEGAEIAANNRDRLAHACDAFSEEPVASFQPKENVHDMMRNIDNEFVVKRSSQAGSTEEGGDLTCENIKVALQTHGEVDRIAAGSECLEKGCTREITFDRDEVVQVGTRHFDCLENGQDVCEREQMFETGKHRDFAVSGDTGRIGNLLSKASGRISVDREDAEGCQELNVQNLTQFEYTVSKAKIATILENTSAPLQLRDSIGEVAMEGSQDLCQMGKNVEIDLEGLLNSRQQQMEMEELSLKEPFDSCDLQEADILEGMTDVSIATSKVGSQQNFLHADCSGAPQHGENSELVKLGELAQQEGDGWFWNPSQQEHVLSVSDLGLCLTGTSEECQLDANSEQENGSAECGGFGVLETCQRLISTDENNRLSVTKAVVKHHLERAGREQNGGELDDLGLEPHLSESEHTPEPEIDTSDWNECDVYVLKQAESNLLNKVPQASDMQDISRRHGMDSVGEKVSQQKGVNALISGSPHKKYLDPVGEFNQCPFKDGGFCVKDSETAPAVEEGDPEEKKSAEIGIGHIDGVQPGPEEKKSTVSEQQQVSSRDCSGNTELAHGQFTGPGSDEAGNVNTVGKLNERIEDLGLDSSKNIQKISVENFAMSSCNDNIEDKQQNLEQFLKPVQGGAPQGHPCEYRKEKDSVSHRNQDEDSFSQSDREEGLDSLKEALQVEKSALAALEAELEKERNAAAIAASEAMAMISRLQEEKSAMQVEVAQFQRMSEEKADYDQQAMSLLKEILFKREKEKFALEKEVELYRERLMAEKVGTMSINRMAKNNGDLPMQEIKSIKLLKMCEDEASASSSSQQISVKCGALNGGLGLETMKDLDNVDRQCSKRLRGAPLNSCDAKEDCGLALDISEEPNKRAFGFPNPFLESSSNESNQCLFKTQQTHQMQKGCEDLSEMGRSVFDTDDEETQFILERLWVLEEELQELRDQGLWREGMHEDCTPVRANFDYLIEESCVGSEDSNKPFSNNFTKTAFQPGTDQSDMVPVYVDSSSLPDLTESSRDRDNSDGLCHAQHVDGTVSGAQNKERGMGGDGFATGGLFPIHDIYEVQPVSKQYRCNPWNLQGSENAENLGDQLQKPDLPPGDMSQALVSSAVENKELGRRRLPRARRLFCSNGAMVQSNGWIVSDALYTDSSWEQDQPDLHTKTQTRIKDDRQTATGADIRQLTMRLKALEADRELLKQTLETFQAKDTGLDLLQEIVQHLRDLRTTDIQRIGAANIPQEVDQHWTTSSKSGIPAVKKRRH